MRTSEQVHPEVFDLVIVGGGPAGLTAAINAESEGLQTLVIDGGDRLGGQARTSTRIENYSGFPGGVDGKTLMSRMAQQALSFHTLFQGPREVDDIEIAEDGFAVMDGRKAYMGRAVLLATGVDFRRLDDAPNVAAYTGFGVEYGSPREEEDFSDKKLFVVGGANSAGQAVMHLSKFTNCMVHLLVRGDSIREKMSAYLADRVENTPNIQILTNTEVECVDGDGQLRKVHLKTPEGSKEMEADQLFIMIGSEPKTDWMPDKVTRDKQGFVIAGADIDEEARKAFIDVTEGRSPLPHETTMPGVFAAGDVRFGTTKRVAGAVGDGATTIPDIHRYLATLSQ